MHRDILIAVGFLVAAIATPASGPAFAEVDLKTPWANIYVGPGGVFVNGPWGRVDVPASERKRVCAEWRKSTLDYRRAPVGEDQWQTTAQLSLAFVA